MDELGTLNNLISESNIGTATTIIFIGSITYSIAHIAYDILTKSDIEKCLTYRGKDRIISSFATFIVFLLITVGSSFEQLAKMVAEIGILFTTISVILVTLFLSIIGVIIFIILIWLFTLTKYYPRYEVKLYDNKDEYWRILKVTKNSRVILKRKGSYLTLPDVKELDYKEIRMQTPKSKKRGKEKMHDVS
ncbi:hypothetical protein [Virgibacillus halodenitrificans]|uniref:hypothetical protein n=1 Tax=Virgibacillus halodenitrificans TaxID=1482 RepID=UPI000EF46475|nr:hypothetical protein [Virgibacillus halodenitrificans]